MNEEVLQTTIRKFLPTVGVSSQHAIEEAISRSLQDGSIRGVESLAVQMTLVIPPLHVRVTFDGELKLR